MSFLEALGAIANFAIAVTASVALYLAWRQIHISRELSALEAYENYHIMCLQYPEFSCNDVPFEKFDKSTLGRYEFFVLYTLMMDERIFALFPNDDGWLYSIKDDIRIHKKFIGSKNFSQNLQFQGWNIKHLIDEVLVE